MRSKVNVAVLGIILTLHCINGLSFEDTFFEKAALELQPILSDFLEVDLNVLGVRGMLVSGLHCGACNIFTTLLNARRKYTKFDRHNVEYFVKASCVALDAAKLVSVPECTGFVNVYADTVLYLINNLNDTKLVCPIIFESDECQVEKHPEYSININTSQPVPRRQLIGNNEEPLSILQITDIHYDPNYKAGSNAACDEHMCCTSSSNSAQTLADLAGLWTDYRDCDIPDYFVKDTFDHIANNDKFDFIYFTGDIISHKLWATSPTSNQRDMEEIWEIFEAYFVGYNLYPIFGNHEPHPGNLFPPDYMNNGQFSIQWLFDKTATLWGNFLPEEALVTVRKGGYYSVSPKQGFRIIAINSNVGYYLNFWMIYDDQDPYGQLQWLADELQKAEDNGEVVHLLSHVSAGSELVNSWSSKLRQIIRRYHNVITGIFTGHTHIDEFNLYFDDKGEPITVAFNGGSLTPYNNVNPNYRIYTVDSTTYDVLDYDTYIVNLTEANTNGWDSPTWQKLYTLTSEYNLKDGSPQSMHQLTTRITEDAQIRQRYYNNSVRYGTPSLKKGCNQECQETLICNIVDTVLSDKSYCDELLKQMK